MAEFHIKPSRAQLALQFIIIIGIALFMFVVFAGIISSKNAELNKEKLMIQAQDITNAVQKEIVIASTVLDGYSREFRIPAKIGSYDYSISIQNTTLILTHSGNDFTKRIPKITGQPKAGLNRINKTGGVVYLN